MRVLIIAPNWIGDALMAQPALELLRRQGASEYIVVLAPDTVAPLFRSMPQVDKVVSTRLAHGKLQWSERTRIARELRHERFDRAVVLPNSLKSALIPWMARIPERIGYLGEFRVGLLTRCIANPGRTLPMVRRYAALVDAGQGELPVPSLTVPAEQRDQVLAKFGIDPRRPVVTLCPGAEYGPAKRWPAQHYAELAERLHNEYPDAELLCLGGPNDRQIANEIATLARAPLRPLAGETSLREVIAILSAAALVVSNDSGLMHVAAALQRPQVAIFGSSDPRHTPPLSTRAQVVWHHLDCSPCFARICPLGHTRCLVELSAKEVQEAVHRALVAGPT